MRSLLENAAARVWRGTTDDGRWTTGAAVLLGVLLLGAGCSMAPRTTTPNAVEVLPPSFDGADAAAERPPLAWWRGFNDPLLDVLIDSVYVRNLDVRAAAARVQEVQAQYRIARAPLLPSVQATVDRTQQSTPANTGLGSQFGGGDGEGNGAPLPFAFPDRFEFTTYSASLGFAYELDFWGRIRGLKDAALRQYFASQADLQTVRLGVLSETIATYFELAELDRLLELTRENVDLLEERLELTQRRFERGLLSSFELYAIQQQFEERRAALPLLEAQRVAARGRLGVLLGRYALPFDSLAAPFDESFSLAPIPAGLPSELLRQRPDVAAAAQRLEAARQAVGVARAEQFPRFALTGSGGTQSRTLTDLVQTSQRFWLFGGSLVAPLFNAGALRAGVRAAWARYEQQAAQYEKTVLTAFQEVEASLAAYQKQQERYRFLLDERAAARDNAAAQERRFIRGLGDYLAYLDAQRNRVRAETSVVQAQRALATTRLAVHRALGGAWVGNGLNVER